MRRFELDGTYFYCALDLTLSVIGGRWKGLVFWNLRNGARRYGEIKRELVTINDKMLSQVLRELEHNGVIERKVFEVIPPKVEYKLTEEGEKLLPIMKLMANWGEKYEVF